MPIEIRRALPSEIHSARQVMAESFGALRTIYVPTRAAKLARVASAVEQSLLIAIEEQEIVGTVEFTVEGQLLRFRALAVKLDRRRRGIARQLVDRLAETARKYGCQALRLFTIRETQNERVFEAMGFRLVAAYCSADYTGPGGHAVTEVEMERTCEDEKLGR